MNTNKASTPSPDHGCTSSHHIVTRISRQLVRLLFISAILLASSYATAGQVTLAWDANAEPDTAGYRVRYGTSPGVYTQTVEAGNSTTATLTNLTAGATYFIAVTAYNTIGFESPPSNEVSFTPSGSPPNQAPIVSLVSPANGSQFNAPASLTVSASASDSDGAIARVEFYSGATKIGEDATSPYTFVWNGVQAGAYSLSAVAFDNQGASTQSAAINVMVNVAVPGPLTGLNATTVSASRINLSWTAATGATSYNVKRSATSGGPYTTVATGVTATSYSDTGLPAQTTYYYTVSAVNAGGEGANSSQASATTLALPPPAPSGLNAIAGNAQVTLNWTASSGAGSYNVKRATVSGGPYAMIATGVVVTNYTDTGLTNGVTYHYAVSAVNAGGESANSNNASATPDAELPSPWVNGDIGAVAASGTAISNNGMFTIEGSGANIGGRADEFHYVYQTASGDCEIVARIATIEYTRSDAKAGLMIRETTASNSRYAGVLLTPASGVRFQRRTSTGGSTSNNTASGIVPPRWIKLTRTGNTFRAYHSTNGTNWTQFGSSRTVSMGTTVTIGLAVSSCVDGTLCTSVMGNVTVSP